MPLMEKEKLYEKYRIDAKHEHIDKINWEELERIYEDFSEKVKPLSVTANTIAQILREDPSVHTVRTRIKDPEHLIEKIIRKTLEKVSENIEYNVTVENYDEKITDLIGIRVIHLYKNQATEIDQLIRETWELHETPIIYYREGDTVPTIDGSEEKARFVHKKHFAGYRSWHYVIQTNLTKQKYLAEIQVRTIFEEGWSEIDHQLRYPYDLDNSLLNDQLLVLNRLAGSADEMVDTIRQTKISQYELLKINQMHQQHIEDLKKELEKVYKDSAVKDEQRKKLEDKFKKLEESQRYNVNVGNNILFGNSRELFSDMNNIADRSNERRWFTNNYRANVAGLPLIGNVNEKDGPIFNDSKLNFLDESMFGNSNKENNVFSDKPKKSNVKKDF